MSKRKKYLSFIALIFTTLILGFTSCNSKFLAEASIKPPRKPLVKNPGDYGMEFQNVDFKSPDGINLKAWYIPGKSDNLIIFTHPMPFNRYGFHTKGQGLMKVSSVEVELLKVVKQLNNEGYGVFIFDFRNHGESEASNNGVCGVGYFEYQDVVGAMNYIKSNNELKGKNIGMVVNCMGANSALIAMSKEPELFKEIKSVVAIQPVSYDVFMKYYLKDKMPFAEKKLPEINKEVKLISGIYLEDMSPKKYISDIKAPIMYVQVRNDAWTIPEDIENFYNLTQSEKELYWIEGDLERFDGYNYFADKPEKMLNWLNKYMN